jgi:isoquinoline 1-oxidoreductase subunit alpha
MTPSTILLTVNGHDHSIDLDRVDPHMPLLWLLRDHLRLTGTKYGCGLSLCGACTVHVDGVATRSCNTPVAVLHGKRVVTIEGLGGKGLHPVQRAWISENVAQCGYCQAGQIMSAAALLNLHPTPTEEEVDAAMSGNLCRCGTYARIRKAIRVASLESTSKETPR